MAATECNFNSRSQKIETEGGGGVGCSLVPSCGVEKRGNDDRGEGERNVRAGMERETSQKGKLRGKDFFLKRENGPECLFCLLLSFPVLLCLVWDQQRADTHSSNSTRILLTCSEQKNEAAPLTGFICWSAKYYSLLLENPALSSCSSQPPLPFNAPLFCPPVCLFSAFCALSSL